MADDPYKVHISISAKYRGANYCFQREQGNHRSPCTALVDFPKPALEQICPYSFLLKYSLESTILKQKLGL